MVQPKSRKPTDQMGASQSPLSRWLEVLRCPECDGRLHFSVAQEARELLCRKCSSAFPIHRGIPSLIHRDRRPAIEKFCSAYEALRLAEGWASAQPAYYDALPFADITGAHMQEWKQRAVTFARLQRWLHRTLQNPNGSLRILDVGAGCGWMSRELAKRDYVIALDVDAGDHGLNAIPWNQRRYLGVQGEFDHYPLADGSFHLVIAGASAHHSSDFEKFLQEAARVLRHEGWLVVMDSPTYPDATTQRAAQRRSRVYFEQIGFPQMAEFYSGIIEGTYQDQKYFNFECHRADISLKGRAMKSLREFAGRPPGARFPIWIGRRRTLPDQFAARGRYRAGVIIRHGDEVLMTRARYQNVEFWHTPGGTLQLGEPPQQAALRRLRAECNLDLEVENELGEYLFPAHREWCFIAKPLHNLERKEYQEFEKQKTHSQATRQWLPIDLLSDYDIRPAALKMDLVAFLKKCK